MLPHISCYPIAIGTCEVQFFLFVIHFNMDKTIKNTDISISMVILGMVYYSFTNIKWNNKSNLSDQPQSEFRL